MATAAQQLAAAKAAAAASKKAAAAQTSTVSASMYAQRNTGVVAQEKATGINTNSTSTTSVKAPVATPVSTSSTQGTSQGSAPVGTAPGPGYTWNGNAWQSPQTVYGVGDPQPGDTWDSVGHKWIHAQTSNGHPAKGTVLSTSRGSKDGFRKDILADGNGGVYYSEDIADANPLYGPSNVNPGATGTELGASPAARNLAENTFANTFALMFGSKEAAEPYVKELYSLVFNFYKTGSTIDESINLALHEAHNNNAIPQFTARFAGLFALKDANLKGAAFKIPTIAEFIAGENDMGDILRSAGMGDIATQEYLGQVIGKGKSVKDVADAINNSFNAIDNAPQDVKDTLATQFPMLDRTTLAKSLLMGPDGAAAIQKKIDAATSVTAVNKQGITGLSANQMDVLTNSGLSYAQQSNTLGSIKTEGARGQQLSNIYGNQVEGYSQNTAFQDQLQNLASAKRAKEQIIAREAGLFGGSTGGLKDSYGTPRNSYSKKIEGQI